MSVLFVDLETIPTQSDAAKERIAATVKHPGTITKAESIKAWEEEKKPQAIRDAIDKTSFSGAYGSICCIGFAFDDAPAQSLSWPLNSSSEKDMLEKFVEVAGALCGNRAPVIVGHNVAAFDIRFMWQRAMVLGVKMPSFFPRDPKPWASDVFDTMTAWAGARDTISMDNLCFALGIEGKGDIDGSMIAQMFADGKHEAIAAYCRSDIEKTRLVYKKMQVALGGNY